MYILVSFKHIYHHYYDFFFVQFFYQDELDETVTPVATPHVEKSFVLMNDSSETLPIPDDSEGIVPPGTETEVPLSVLTPGIVPPGTESELSSQNDNETASTDNVPVKTENDTSEEVKITTTTLINTDTEPSIVPTDTTSVLSLTIDPNILPPPGIECELSPTDNDIVPPGTENESDEQMDFVSVKEEETRMEVDSHISTCNDTTVKVENNDNDNESPIADDNSKTNIKTESLEDDYIDSAADSPEYPLIPSSERISTDEKLNPSSVVSEG